MILVKWQSRIGKTKLVSGCPQLDKLILVDIIKKQEIQNRKKTYQFHNQQPAEKPDKIACAK